MPVYRATLEYLGEAPNRAALCAQLEAIWPELSELIVKLEDLPDRRQQPRHSQPKVAVGQ